MAKVDRKNKENQQGEKHSLSSFEKKRGAKVAFNYAQARTNKKYRVVNVQKEHRDITPTGKAIHGAEPVNAAEKENTSKPVKNMAGRTFTNGQTANRKTESRTPDAVQKSESAVTQPEKTISPEIAQRMKRAAFLQEQNNAKIKMNTASAAVSKTEHSPEKISDTNSVPDISANDSGEKKPYEHKYVSQTADSIIPEQKKTITPEMALRMKRAAFIAQKNEEAKIAKTLDSEKFRKIPFDYNNVWTTVMEWSRSKLIQKKGNSIVVPISELQKLPENDQEYAKRMIAEQYSLKKSSNKMLQKLSDLKNYANKEMKVKEQQKALKDDRAAPITEEDKV